MAQVINVIVLFPYMHWESSEVHNRNIALGANDFSYSTGFSNFRMSEHINPSKDKLFTGLSFISAYTYLRW